MRLVLPKKIFSWENGLNCLLIFFPLVIVLEIFQASPVIIFFFSCLGIIPLAGIMGKATEHLSERVGAGIGGLLNATFGNAAELIIARLALHKGLYQVVKASLTGSIIGNSLLVLGLSLQLGGAKHSLQTFNRTAAGLGITLLTLSLIGLLIPGLFHWAVTEQIQAGTVTQSQESILQQELRLTICIVLFVVYGLHLILSLRTHKDLFLGRESKGEHVAQQ